MLLQDSPSSASSQPRRSSSASTLADNLVYLSLMVLLVAEVCRGPLKNLWDDETKFVKDKVLSHSFSYSRVLLLFFLSFLQVDSSESSQPTISLCKLLGFRCGRHSSECDQAEWTSLADVVEDAFAIQEFYERATISRLFEYSQPVRTRRFELGSCFVLVP